MKKRLCFVIPSMRRGGAERVMSILLNSSIEKGYNVTLILLSDNSVDYEISPLVNVVNIPDLMIERKGIKALNRLRALRKAILVTEPDLVISFLTTCNIYVAMALKGTKIPFIVSERNDPTKDCPSKIKRFVRNHCYKCANGVIFQTEDARKHFSKKITDGSVIIPNPVKSGLPFASIDDAENVVVAAARLTEQKNYPMLLRAFKIFLKNHANYTLKIFGDGEKREELVALLVELGISDKVSFEGNVSDLHERIKTAKMFVLSSDYEGISNSLLEAMAMGLPVVSTDCPCGGSAMLIEDGKSGFLTPVGDELAFVGAMSKIADSLDVAYGLSENAKNVRDLYSEEFITGRYEEYFDCVLHKTKKL